MMYTQIIINKRGLCMNKLDIKIKKLDPRAIIPTYGTEYSAGADLYALAYPDLSAAVGGSLWREGPVIR